jgi:hypothetical protein
MSIDGEGLPTFGHAMHGSFDSKLPTTDYAFLRSILAMNCRPRRIAGSSLGWN